MKRTLLLFAALLSLSTGVFAQRATLDPAKGWTTTLTALPEDVSQYFFAIYDHDTEKAMVLAAGNNQGAANQTMWYKTNVDPETNKNAMWAFDGFNHDNYSGASVENLEWLIITGVSNMDYCLQHDNPWNYRTGNNGDGWTDRCYVAPAYLPEGYWTLRNNNGNDSIGHWDNTDEIAGNVTGERVGHYDFYAILRGKYVEAVEALDKATADNPIDISYVITNADATRRNRFHAAQPVGWKLSQNDAFECEFANYLPSKVGDSYFNKWQESGNLTDRSMSQTVTGLPSGRYRLSVTTSSSVIHAGAYLFANDKEADMTQLTDNKASITLEITNGKLEFGVRLKNYTSNDCKFDHFTLEYLGGWSVPVAFTAAGWATYCSPYALDFSSDINNLTAAYIITGVAGNKLTLVKVTGTVPANTGLLLKGEGACAIPVAASSSTDVSSNKLVGVTSSTLLDAKAGYVLMGSPSVGFYKNANNFTLGANTAYLPAGIAEARPVLYLDEDDAPTAISFAEQWGGAERTQLKDGKYFVGNRIVIVKNGVKFSANGQILK